MSFLQQHLQGLPCSIKGVVLVAPLAEAYTASVLLRLVLRTLEYRQYAEGKGLCIRGRWNNKYDHLEGR